MGKNTGIQWTDHSWPVVNGCRRISPGCGGPHGAGGCYAERLVSTRLRKQPKYEGLAEFTEGGPRWTGKSRLWVPDLWLPLRTRKPAKWFVANMGDLFFEEVSNEEIAAVFGVMAACPQHTFQVLTKRPERMREWFEWFSREAASVPGMVGAESPSQGPEGGCAALYTAKYLRTCDGEEFLTSDGFLAACQAKWPLPNVILMISAEDQDLANRRLPILLATPAAARGVSAEPLLGPINLERVRLNAETDMDVLSGTVMSRRNGGVAEFDHIVGKRIDWIIAGGESGPGARASELAWHRSLRNQCKAAGVAFFEKQLGAVPIERMPHLVGGHGGFIDLTPKPVPEGWTLVRTKDEAFLQRHLRLKDRHGGDMSEWPADLRVREFPEVRP